MVLYVFVVIQYLKKWHTEDIDASIENPHCIIWYKANFTMISWIISLESLHSLTRTWLTLVNTARLWPCYWRCSWRCTMTWWPTIITNVCFLFVCVVVVPIDIRVINGVYICQLYVVFLLYVNICVCRTALFLQ